MTFSSRRLPLLAPILLYAAAGLEIIIMVSPFAAYFYSVYGPVFSGLERSAATAWLPQFFLPHLAYTKFVLFRYVEWAGALMAAIGVVGFLVCAIQLYYGKFVRRQLVGGGLYGRVRHPQYLCLAMAGVGLLLLWPRFFILVTFVVMLGLYYVLARHEEEAIIAKYGQASKDYMARVSMWNPFRRPQPAATWQPMARRRAFTIWLTLFVVSIGLAFALRAGAVTQLHTVQSASANVTALAFRPMPDDEIRSTMEAVLATDAARELIQQNREQTWLMQITPGRGQLRHLLIDLGMTAEARNAIDVPETGNFVVVSLVQARQPGASGPLDPFSFSTRIQPLLLAYPPDAKGWLAVQALRPEQFYDGFVKILF